MTDGPDGPDGPDRTDRTEPDGMDRTDRMDRMDGWMDGWNPWDCYDPVFDDPKGISLGSMDFDNSKIYGDVPSSMVLLNTQ